MSLKESSYDQILADIAVIRRSIAGPQTSSSGVDVIDVFKLGSSMTLHALALSVSLPMMSYELITRGAYSRTIMASIHSPVLRNNYLLSGALLLISLVAVAYGFLWFYSRRNNETLQ